LLKREYLTVEQKRVVEKPVEGRLYLEGVAGTGKTTAGVHRALEMIRSGNNPASILILLPQRRLGEPYKRGVASLSISPEIPEIVTIAGLARRMVELFWPMIAESAGFQGTTEPPRFLTVETAQYHMAKVIGPYLDEGYFEGLSLDRYRLYRQIIDNLNKAAVVGFPMSEINERLSEAWVGPEDHTRIYEQAQHCAEMFRAECYEQNLVDFSLQYELFFNYVETLPEFENYFTAHYKHLLVDNVEEETPQGHDFIRRWLPSFESVLIIADSGGGYSRFLGADPENIENLREDCGTKDVFQNSFVASQAIQQFSDNLRDAIYGKRESSLSSLGDGILVKSLEYLPDLLDWVVKEIDDLIKASVPASEIVIVSPFVSDSLRFLLTRKLEDRGIPWASHRPSRAISDEPFNRCLLTIAALSHPGWQISPSREAVAHSLMTAIEGLDLVRATLLASTLYRATDQASELSSVEQLRPEMLERIGLHIGEKFERLREWIIDSVMLPTIPLDHFISRLFGELLSQPGYGFHDRMDAGRAAAAMITSIKKFRSVAATSGETAGVLGKSYYQLIHEGLLAGQYLTGDNLDEKGAVLIAPAVTYLTMDRRSEVQFWLDIGSPAWAERLYQPLTHPYVLSRNWQRGQKWTDEHEWAVRREIVSTITTGLARRCRKRIYLCHSTYGEQGLEQVGILSNAVQRLLSLGMTPQQGSIDV
jgi:hypothetical protein